MQNGFCELKMGIYSPGWYFHHRDFYDNYDRGEGKTAVYLGEWASKGTMTSNALIEAAYMTNLERNADIVRMSSYAPLLAKDRHTSWNPSLIYFDNHAIHPTANYYVQRLFGQNSGDSYIYSNMTADYKDLVAKKGAKPLLRDITITAPLSRSPSMECLRDTYYQAEEKQVTRKQKQRSRCKHMIYSGIVVSLVMIKKTTWYDLR